MSSILPSFSSLLAIASASRRLYIMVMSTSPWTRPRCHTPSIPFFSWKPWRASKRYSSAVTSFSSSFILDHLLHRRWPRNGPVYRLGVGLAVRASHGTTVYAALGSALARTCQHATQRSGPWPPRAGACAPPLTRPSPRDTEDKHPTARRSSRGASHPGLAPTVVACAPLRSCCILRVDELIVQVAKVAFLF